MIVKTSKLEERRNFCGWGCLGDINGTREKPGLLFASHDIFFKDT